MHVLAILKQRFQQALVGLTEDPAALLEMIRPAQDPKFGDYQANCAMPLGKELHQPPREVAAKIVERLNLDELCEPPEIAGPGFINLRLRNTWLVRQLAAIQADERLGVAVVAQPRRFVVDYSSPNVAKPMHVGHIRSTVIGDALSRTLRFLGHTVITDNHLGDWGTQFGMVIYGYRHFADPAAFATHPVRELGRVYRQVRQLIDFQEGQTALPNLQAQVADQDAAVTKAARAVADADKAERKKLEKNLRRLETQRNELRAEIAALEARLQTWAADPQLRSLAAQHPDVNQAVLVETAKLHQGDLDNLRLWQEFLPHCRHEIERVYRRLDIQFDFELGESFYHDRLGDVVADFQDRGLARESEGAICIFLPDFDAPMIIRKKDGAYLYATTDLATIQYRMAHWHPDVILYVVDFRQSEHFRKLFAAARLWGYHEVELVHVGFGTVLGDDGRPFRTRAGETVGLEALLDEAVDRAFQVVTENDDAHKDGGELSPEQRAEVASRVGHAAIKYADLSQNRTSDYVFSYDKMVAMQGNTATYLQYSYARTQAILSKSGVSRESLLTSAAPMQLEDDKERLLAVELLRFEEALLDLVADYRPNMLANYLFGLARRFAEFYDACPVLRAEDQATRGSRLQLVELTGRTLQTAMSLLGIRVVDRM
jgi:arginyl-tRNA synthetase